MIQMLPIEHLWSSYVTLRTWCNAMKVNMKAACLPFQKCIGAIISSWTINVSRATHQPSSSQCEHTVRETQDFYTVCTQQCKDYSGRLASNALGPLWLLGGSYRLGWVHNAVLQGALTLVWRCHRPIRGFPENKTSISHICTLQETS